MLFRPSRDELVAVSNLGGEALNNASPPFCLFEESPARPRFSDWSDVEPY
jgi:hypothetical protein